MPLCSSPLEKQRTGRAACSSWGFWFVIIKWWITFTEAELIRPLPRKQMSLWGKKKGTLPVIQACVVSGYWSGPKHLAALPPLPDVCAQYALLLCGSPCGEGLAFYFKAAGWQVSREIGTFLSGLVKHYLFFASCCLKGCFPELWGSWAALNGKGEVAIHACWLFLHVLLFPGNNPRSNHPISSFLCSFLFSHPSLVGILLCWFPLPQLYIF